MEGIHGSIYSNQFEKNRKETGFYSFKSKDPAPKI